MNFGKREAVFYPPGPTETVSTPPTIRKNGTMAINLCKKMETPQDFFQLTAETILY